MNEEQLQKTITRLRIVILFLLLLVVGVAIVYVGHRKKVTETRFERLAEQLLWWRTMRQPMSMSKPPRYGFKEIHSDFDTDKNIGYEFDVFEKEDFVVKVSRTPFPYIWDPEYEIIHLKDGEQHLTIKEFNKILKANTISSFPYGNSPLGRINWPEEP